MALAKLGDTVRVHYTGTLNDGAIFDTSENMDPLEFTLGEGMVIPGFENAVLGMNVGETKKVNLSPDEGYGMPDDELVMVVERDDLPPELTPEVGMILKATSEEGDETHIVITDVEGTSVTLDGNHPLAGQELIFEIQLVEIVE